jgi:hypothetical protein
MMAKIDITRTEMVGPGKFNEDGTSQELKRTLSENYTCSGFKAQKS